MQPNSDILERIKILDANSGRTKAVRGLSYPFSLQSPFHFRDQLSVIHGPGSLEGDFVEPLTHVGPRGKFCAASDEKSKRRGAAQPL